MAFASSLYCSESLTLRKSWKQVSPKLEIL